MSSPNDLKTFEKISSMKNMLGVSLIDMLKPNIKTKQNDNVIKMLDIVKDKPEAYLELLSVAIIHKNFEIMKLIIDKYIFSDLENPYINALSFYNSILPDNSSNKLVDSTNNYIDVVCPYALMAGIGGDIKIFNYLLKHHLISDLNIQGAIGFSKKFKNVIISNIIGACSYYGNDELLEYLLKNHRSELDINLFCSEKKNQKYKNSFFKRINRFNTCHPRLCWPFNRRTNNKNIKNS